MFSSPAVDTLWMFVSARQVEEDERVQPDAGQHLRLQRTRIRGLQTPASSGLGALREMVHGSGGQEDRHQGEERARDPVHPSGCASTTCHLLFVLR